MAIVFAIGGIVSYFIGNINPAILLGRARGIDIRAHGSGNAGSTNALRALGRKAGALTFAIDVAKGWACFFAALHLSALSPPAAGLPGTAALETAFAFAMLCGLCVAVGHMYPAAFGFRGGKGVATTFGVLLAADWRYALVSIAVVAAMALFTRRVSLSVLVAVACALVLLFTGAGGIARPAWMQGAPLFSGVWGAADLYPIWITALFALIVWKHRANIARLARGEEPKLSLGGKGGKA